MNKKVTWGEAWVVLRPVDGTDDIVAQIISADVMNTYGPTDKGIWRQFGQICSATVESSGCAVRFETMRNADTLTRRAGYEAFVRLPGRVIDHLLATYNAVNRALDVTVSDVPDETDKKKA